MGDFSRLEATILRIMSSTRLVKLMNWLKTNLLTKKLLINQLHLTKSKFWKQQTNGRRLPLCWRRELDLEPASLEIHTFMYFVVCVIREKMKRHQLLCESSILLKNMTSQMILGLKWPSLQKTIFYPVIISELSIPSVFIAKKKVWSFLQENTTLLKIQLLLKSQMFTSFTLETKRER